MSDEDKKGRLPEDDVGTPEESSGFEDKINATLDKILDDDEDEFDDIIVDYEEAGEEEESEDAEEEETGDTSEKTIIWNGPSETEEEYEEEVEEETFKLPETEAATTSLGSLFKNIKL